VRHHKVLLHLNSYFFDFLFEEDRVGADSNSKAARIVCDQFVLRMSPRQI
jgi:hypothetical protein